MIFLTIHKISYYKVRVSTGSVETRWMGGSFSMVYRNNTGRLGSGLISVCLETRWLCQKSGFYVPEQPCIGGSGVAHGISTDWGLSAQVGLEWGLSYRFE